MEPISLTIGAVVGLAGIAADHLNRLSVQGTIQGTGGALFVGQLLTTAYLSSKIEEVGKKLGHVSAAIGRVEANASQIRCLQIAQAISPVRNAVEKLEEIRAEPNADVAARAELLKVLDLLEVGSAQVRQALDVFSGAELLELPEMFINLLSALSSAAECEISLKAALGYSSARLAKVAKRYAESYAALALKLQSMPRFDKVLPSPTMLRAARSLRQDSVAEMRRQFIGALATIEHQFLLEASKLALLSVEPNAAV